ncbi:MAG: hypothetical protein MUC69_11915, partial [Gemmatimonadales bacterium]|nr:hypothetical protein [Gemmatimonadales bacterium]
MTALMLLLQLQRPTPTIGDTIWIARTIAVPAGATVRPLAWMPEGEVEALGPARVRTWSDSAEVAYPAVAWRPGSHDVTVPGPLLLLPGGGVDSVGALARTITVASILPPGTPDSSVAARPAVAPIPLGERTWRPLLALW